MKPLRIYVDTSVIGGCFDEEFSEDSQRLLAAAGEGRIVLLLGPVVLRELASAPAQVVAALSKLPGSSVERVELTEEVIILRDAYIAAGILGPRWEDDAAHVASATVARADAIASWNFRHIVRLDKMKAYNQVNLMHGYGVLTIVSPREVRIDEPSQDEEDV